ncbi:MAG: hypothetical protein ACRCS5_03520, partial [Sphingomonas sp.]|uniref:hypothetical protein n=1 Tax=Sphingomonas sp. TaxID=28214 RepID=UPI003F38775C
MILTTLLMALFGTPDFPNHLGTGIEAQPAAIDPAQTCELHVFPTQEIIDSSPDYESPFGTPLLVGAAIAALQHTGSGRAKAGALKEMKILFEPRIQIEELQRANLLAALKLPQNTQVIQEAALPALWGSTPEESEPKSAYKRYWTAMKTGTALVASSSRCYREIYVAS